MTVRRSTRSRLVSRSVKKKAANNRKQPPERQPQRSLRSRTPTPAAAPTPDATKAYSPSKFSVGDIVELLVAAGGGGNNNKGKKKEEASFLWLWLGILHDSTTRLTYSSFVFLFFLVSTVPRR